MNKVLNTTEEDDLDRCHRIRREIDDRFESLSAVFEHLKKSEHGRKLGSPLWKRADSAKRKLSKMAVIQAAEEHKPYGSHS